MWDSIGKGLAKLAVWALGNPEVLLGVVKAIVAQDKAAKGGK